MRKHWTIERIKKTAWNITKGHRPELKHTQVLEAVARSLGFKDWHELCHSYDSPQGLSNTQERLTRLAVMDPDERCERCAERFAASCDMELSQAKAIVLESVAPLFGHNDAADTEHAPTATDVNDSWRVSTEERKRHWTEIDADRAPIIAASIGGAGGVRLVPKKAVPVVVRARRRYVERT